MEWIVKLFGGSIVSAVMGAINKFQDRKMTEAEMKAEVEKAVLGTLTEVSKSQADVIMAETNSDDKLTRRWRPIVALTSFFSVWFVIILYPFLVAWGVLSQVRFGEVGLNWMFTLTSICVGGYIGGRTVEKVTDKIASRRS